MDNTELDSLLKEMVSSPWNCTSIQASIAKTMIALHHGTLWQQVEVEYDSLKSRGSEYYMEKFYQDTKNLQDLIDISAEKELITERLLRVLRQSPNLRHLTHNYAKLITHDLIEALRSFNTTFRGKIETIYPLEQIDIIKSKRDGDTWFYLSLNKKDIVSECWATLDDAILGAVIAKYQPNHNGWNYAQMYITRMLEMPFHDSET